MGENTFHYQPEKTAGTYWRRRFLTLITGLAVLALISWALSGALSASLAGRPAVTGPGKLARGAAPGSGGSVPAGGHSPSAGGGASQPGSSGRSTPAASRSGATSSPRPTASGKSSYPGIRPAFCARHDIVLSLFSSQASFGRRQVPSFSLDVVSTQPAECSFNVGPGYLALVIKEGSARIWSSADCVRGSVSLVSALKRGVPTVLPVTWDRRTSSPGCSRTVTRVPAGVYTAYAAQGSMVSAPVTFRLG